MTSFKVLPCAFLGSFKLCVLQVSSTENNVIKFDEKSLYFFLKKPGGLSNTL